MSTAYPCSKQEIQWRKAARRRTGAITAELIASIPILVIITIFSINTGTLIFAVDFCDRACLDCARAAGEMSTPDQAVNAMNAAALGRPLTGTFFQELWPELLVYQDYNNSSSSPTPLYGSTETYTAKNGPDNVPPATEDPKPVNPATKNTKENKDTNDIKDTKDITTPPINLAALITDPKQTVTPGPHVVVRTTLIMRIPIYINFFGNKPFAGNMQDSPQLFKIESVYTFPITNTYAPI